MSWFLQIGDGAPQSFSELGCVGLKRELRSQTPGTFTFRVNLQTIESDPIASVDDLARVQWIVGGTTTIFFAGRVTRVPLAGSTAKEDQTYEISDGWSDFERITFQQQWNRITSVDEEGNPTIAAQFSACCLLGVDLEGNPQSSGQVIADAVNWAISRGANCRLGTILVDGFDNTTASPVPIDEVRDLPCAEIIKKMMRFTPDGVAWFDYATTPPTFNVTRQANCAAVTLPFADNGDGANITPRNDLVRPQVLLRYEQPNVSDGETFTAVYVDAAPGGADGLAFGALVATVRLAGSNATFQKQPVTTMPIPTGPGDSNAVPFLQLNHGWLRSLSPDRLEVTSLSVAVDNPQNDDMGVAVTDFTITDYPNQLLTGTVTKWMKSAYPTLKVARVTVTAQVSYQYPDIADDESERALLYFGPDDGNLDNWDNDVTVLTGIKGTNALQQTYALLSSYTEPESPPMGMAAALYSALSVLQYEGQYTTASCEAAPATSLGMVLNLAGGRAEWAAMNALVQEISDDLDTGTTTYKFGPAAHLTIQDLMEQLRATRKRTMSWKIKERQTGQPDNDVVNGPGHTADTNPSMPPAPTHYPWIDFIDEQDDGDGNGVTWDALLGYGQSSFADSSGIDHADPIEKFELSIGNDGSDWTGPDHDATDLTWGFSIQSGNDDPENDLLFIGAAAGSITLTPNDPSIWLSPNLETDDDDDDTPHINISLGDDMLIEIQDEDGSYIDLDLSDSPIINISNADTGSYSSLDENSLSLSDGGDGSEADLEASNMTLTDGGSGDTIYLDASSPEITFTSADASSSLGAETLAIETDSGDCLLTVYSLHLSDDGSGGSIALDASATSGKALYVQEISVCVDGDSKAMMILASDPY